MTTTKPKRLPPDTVLTVAEAVDYSGLSRATLDRRLRDGSLPHQGEPRARIVLAGDVDKLLGRAPAEPPPVPELVAPPAPMVAPPAPPSVPVATPSPVPAPAAPAPAFDMAALLPQLAAYLAANMPMSAPAPAPPAAVPSPAPAPVTAPLPAAPSAGGQLDLAGVEGKPRAAVARADGRELRRTTVYFDTVAYRRLAMFCVGRDMEVSAVVQRAVLAFLDSNGG